MKYPSCTFCILLICDSFSPIQLSEFANIFEDILDLYCSTGPCAMLNHIKLGWLQMLRIVFPLYIAMGILESRVERMLADFPSSCIWSPRYFSALDFLLLFPPFLLG